MVPERGRRELPVNLRRLVPLGLAAFAAWRRLSPSQKAKIKSTIVGLAGRTRGAARRNANP